MEVIYITGITDWVMWDKYGPITVVDSIITDGYPVRSKVWQLTVYLVNAKV